MFQFIVRMHYCITNHDLVWRQGVVLEHDDTKAEIIEIYDKRLIKIRIAGKNRRDFMTIIREGIDRINGQYEKMLVEKLIPVSAKNVRKAMIRISILTKD